MKQVSYIEEETYYVAGRDFEDARERLDRRGYEETPQRAWDALGYWEREEEADQFEVFKFEVTTQVTQVSPPYCQ